AVAMSPDPRFPRPAPGPVEAPFWEWCRRGELRLQRCGDCGRWRHHPRPRCPACRSPRYFWERASGRASVYSFTVCYPPVLPAFAEAVPYVAVVVRLEEGPFMVSHLLDCPPEAVEVGMEVELAMVPVDEELVLPYFRPTAAPAPR
ncbi:MAG TPA: OB-fold domain-containing protein, partial [Acidimicrobiales bacterium]|nr:OB-fold domain-containing protein [Acidimicrobiales bacterium]